MHYDVKTWLHDVFFSVTALLFRCCNYSCCAFWHVAPVCSKECHVWLGHLCKSIHDFMMTCGIKQKYCNRPARASSRRFWLHKCAGSRICTTTILDVDLCLRAQNHAIKVSQQVTTAKKIVNKTVLSLIILSRVQHSWSIQTACDNYCFVAVGCCVELRAHWSKWITFADHWYFCSCV